MNTNPMLLIDFYKAVHAEMLPENITKSVSYFTPRMSRVKRWDKVVMFGLQGFIQKYLIDYFNDEFFNKPFDEVIYDYKRIMDATLGKDIYNIEKIEKLHKLGYLPIEIVALPEGTRVPMHVPMFGITNTHKDFAWLPQSLESLISAESWHPMIAATVGATYRDIVNEYYDRTCDDNVSRARALGAFDFRGEESLESAVKAGAGWCLSFLNTATVPTIPYLEKYYGCDCTKEPVAFGSPSTEHAVMCSNYGVDGDEITFLNKLFTQIYPSGNVSVVCDSYDYWNVVSNIICKDLKSKILSRDGCILVRGDSGHPEEIIAGKNKYPLMRSSAQVKELTNKLNGTSCFGDFYFKTLYEGKFTYYKFSKTMYGNCTSPVEVIPDPSDIGTVECLFNAFGGSINSKGYIVLDSHVKAIYGDSITVHLAEEIYRRLEKNGFASCNVALGVGSFSMQCIEEDGVLKPFTRDTFSSCIKATYCEINDKPYPIFKNPKDSNFKKSQKGCCVVYQDGDELVYEDGYTWTEAVTNYKNQLRTVFVNGTFIEKQTLSEIRNILHEGKF